MVDILLGGCYDWWNDWPYRVVVDRGYNELDIERQERRALRVRAQAEGKLHSLWARIFGTRQSDNPQAVAEARDECPICFDLGPNCSVSILPLIKRSCS
jgi:hypothetical protein